MHFFDSCGYVVIRRKKMFGYSKEELMEYYLEYPQNQNIVVKKFMPFVISSAFPMMNERERIQMDLLKQRYDSLLCELEQEGVQKKKIASICLSILYEAIDLYDHAFDRLANSYFCSIYN